MKEGTYMTENEREWEIERDKIMKAYEEKQVSYFDIVAKHGADVANYIEANERESKRNKEYEERLNKEWEAEKAIKAEFRVYLKERLYEPILHVKNRLETFYERSTNHWLNALNGTKETSDMVNQIVNDILYPQQSQERKDLETLKLIFEEEEKQAKQRRDAQKNLDDILGT